MTSFEFQNNLMDAADKDGIEFIIKIRNVFYRRILIICAVLCVSLVVGYSLSKLEKPYYSTSISLVSIQIPYLIVEREVNKLGYFLENNDRGGLENYSGFSTDLCNNLKGINIQNLTTPEAIDIVKSNYFSISCEVFDSEKVNEMELEIVNYFNSSGYFKNLAEIRGKNFKKQLEVLESELVTALATRKKHLSAENNSIITIPPLSSLDILQELELLSLKNHFSDPITVVSGFDIQKKKSGPSLFNNLINALLAGVIISVFIVFFLEINRIIK
jgi:hypothetical protein